ncbi:MAG: von Willebrand factor type A domain-containing protein [Sneathiellaceae bacterium]
MDRSAVTGIAGGAAAALLAMLTLGGTALAAMPDPATRQYCASRFAPQALPERGDLPRGSANRPVLLGKPAADIAAGTVMRQMAEPAPAAPVPPAPGILREREEAPGWGERYPATQPSGVVETARQPRSTFAADVDTASLSNVRRWLRGGRLPPPDAVRPEELVNAFDYAYPAPGSRAEGFRPTAALFPAPWRDDRHLLAIGIKGWTMPDAERPDANLVLLLDVSGSMRAAEKLPLVKQAFCLLLHGLEARDTVSIVTYASGTGTALPPTSAAEREKVLAALEALSAGGSTAGASGLELAYAAARMARRPGAADRVIVATDGDFNIGPSDTAALTALIRRQAADGIDLNLVGVGNGNVRDDLMQALAQNGNGIAVQLDGIEEAERVFVRDLTGSLVTVARDVKIQVEFNPARVTSWRLIGYETRALEVADFRDDAVDAGEIGSGHTVTALYEVTLAGLDPSPFPPLRYGPQPAPPAAAEAEFARIALRFVPGDGGAAREVVRTVAAADLVTDPAALPHDRRFAAAVAWFARKLRGDSLGDGKAAGGGWAALIRLADNARGPDPDGRRAGLVDLIRRAARLDPAGG